MAGNKCIMIEGKRTNIDLEVSFLAYESENPVKYIQLNISFRYCMPV